MARSESHADACESGQNPFSEPARFALAVAFMWAGFMKLHGGSEPNALVPESVQYGGAVAECLIGAALVVIPGESVRRGAMFIAFALVSLAVSRSLFGTESTTCGCLGRAVRLSEAQQLAAAGCLALLAAVVNLRRYDLGFDRPDSEH